MTTTVERLKQIRKDNSRMKEQIIRRYYENANAQMNGQFISAARRNNVYVAKDDGTLEMVAEADAS